MSKLGFFTQWAMVYIANHPGCCKRDVIMAVPYNAKYGRMANATYAYRNTRLSKLIDRGWIRNTNPNNYPYRLELTELGREILESAETAEATSK
ncbi:MAG: hypothetical protein D6706_15080 [Chloroflexi bacterium]|nr:MAG: hypothetical protein D6706_15080 [Chloroflexota bacterium]